MCDNPIIDAIALAMNLDCVDGVYGVRTCNGVKGVFLKALFVGDLEYKQTCILCGEHAPWLSYDFVHRMSMVLENKRVIAMADNEPYYQMESDLIRYCWNCGVIYV